MKTEVNLPIKISDGIFLVGSDRHSSGTSCNTYLIIDGNENILIDPGIVDFEIIVKNISSIISPDAIQYCIIHHSHASNISNFWQRGIYPVLVTHWRTSLFIKNYSNESSFYLVDRYSYSLKLKSGRVLKFIPAPYLFFPGAIISYDEKTGTIFSGNLFGSFSFDGEVWAKPDNIESMKSYHEHFMPSNSIMRPVLETLEKLEIRMIAPQTGYLIRGNISGYISALKELECGAYLSRQNPAENKKVNYNFLCNRILSRLYSIYTKDDILFVFMDSHIALDENGFINTAQNNGIENWNNFFKVILSKKDAYWLYPVEILIRKFSIEYGIPFPDALDSAMPVLIEQSPQVKSIEKKIKETETKIIFHPPTGLYNERFFYQYLLSEIDPDRKDKINFCIIFIEIDNLIQINNKFGRETGDETLIHLAYLLKSFKQEDPERVSNLIFKLNGPAFVYLTAKTKTEDILAVAEQIRMAVITAEIFITPITISIGIVNKDDIIDSLDTKEKFASSIIEKGRFKVRIARKSGKNIIYEKLNLEDYHETIDKILIADTDMAGVELLKKSFESLNYEVLYCDNGIRAFETIDKERPSAVICELMLPGMDAFAIRSKTLQSPRLRDIFFVLTAYEKNDSSIERAHSLKIRHFFKKPYYSVELVGIVKGVLEETIL